MTSSAPVPASETRIGRTTSLSRILRRPSARLRLGIAVAVALQFQSSAGAQELEGVALNRFDPAAHGSDWFQLDSLDIQGDGRFSLGLLGDFARKPLVLYDANGDEITAPIESQLYLHSAER